jgi:putative endonuclease
MFAWVERLKARFRSVPLNVGSEGERIAADWLERQCRFRILTRNWRSPRDNRLEIDLVARDGDTLVFVEVKARPSYARVPGYFAATTPRKRKALLRAARAYLHQLREKPRTIRYDVVEVDSDLNKASDEKVVRHFENVPLFSKDFLRGR